MQLQPAVEIAFADMERAGRQFGIAFLQASPQFVARHIEENQFHLRAQRLRPRATVLTLGARPETVFEDDVHSARQNLCRHLPLHRLDRRADGVELRPVTANVIPVKRDNPFVRTQAQRAPLALERQSAGGLAGAGQTAEKIKNRHESSAPSLHQKINQILTF